MKKIISAVTAAAVTSVFALSAVTPASAQASFSFSVGSDRDRADRAFRRYCEDYPRDRDCRRYLRGQFRDRDYYNFYNTRRNRIDAFSSGLFGFTLGAIFLGAAANAAANDGDDEDYEYSLHVERCEARFRSYDEETDTYLGYDGDRHRCRL